MSESFIFSICSYPPECQYKNTNITCKKMNNNFTPLSFTPGIKSERHWGNHTSKMVVIFKILTIEIPYISHEDVDWVESRIYHKISNIRCTKYQNLHDSNLLLQFPLPNPLKPVLSREWRCSWSSANRSWCSQLHLSDQKFYFLLRCNLY